MTKYVVQVKNKLTGEFYGYLRGGGSNVVCSLSLATKYSNLDDVTYDMDKACIQFPDYVCIYQKLDSNLLSLKGYTLSCVVKGELRWLSKGGRLIKNSKSAYVFKSLNPLQAYILRLRGSRNAINFKINVVE